MPDLPFADQILDRAGDLLDRHVRVDAVLIEEVDAVGLEPRQRRLRDQLCMRRTAVQARLFAVLDPEPELRRNDDAIANRGKGFTDELLVGEGTVDLGDYLTPKQ